jgi:exodeoxyribonuclease VII large subunit
MYIITVHYGELQQSMAPDVILSVSDFVAVFNQTVEYAYPTVTIVGEIANFRVSKNRWVYFDLKDDGAIVRFFGTVYQLPGPLEDGMLLQVKGAPKLHPLYGFSVTVLQMQPTGEGSIKKAAALLEAKLAKEGLFDVDRKRGLPYPPQTIGLVTSGESAAFRDFIKVINARWGGMKIILADVQVQGEAAVGQIVEAITLLNQQTITPDVIVVTRGGGSSEDLQAFSSEQVTRAVAASRVPTIVAIGHEVDVSLAELAADQRASTPSNAAELLVPDRRAVLREVRAQRDRLPNMIQDIIERSRQRLNGYREQLDAISSRHVHEAQQALLLRSQLLSAFNPQTALERGYALVRKDEKIIRGGGELKVGDTIDIQMLDATVTADIRRVIMRRNYGKEKS